LVLEEMGQDSPLARSRRNLLHHLQERRYRRGKSGEKVLSRFRRREERDR